MLELHRVAFTSQLSVWRGTRYITGFFLNCFVRVKVYPSAVLGVTGWGSLLAIFSQQSKPFIVRAKDVGLLRSLSARNHPGHSVILGDSQGYIYQYLMKFKGHEVLKIEPGSHTYKVHALSTPPSLSSLSYIYYFKAQKNIYAKVSLS